LYFFDAYDENNVIPTKIKVSSNTEKLAPFSIIFDDDNEPFSGDNIADGCKGTLETGK
jgi:hypothetical protein